MESEVTENPESEMKSEREKEETCLKLLDALIETTRREYHEVIEKAKNLKQQQLSKLICQDPDSESGNEECCGGFEDRKQKKKQLEMDARIRAAILADEDSQSNEAIDEDVKISKEPCGTHSEPCGTRSNDTSKPTKKLCVNEDSDSSPCCCNKNDKTFKPKTFHSSLMVFPKSQLRNLNAFPQHWSSVDQLHDPEEKVEQFECGKVQIELYEKLISNLFQERQKNVEVIFQLKHQINCYEKKFQDLEKLAEVASKYENLMHDVSKLQKELQVFQLREQIYQSFLTKRQGDLCLDVTENNLVDNTRQLFPETQPELCDSHTNGDKNCCSSNLSDKNESCGEIPENFDHRFVVECTQVANDCSPQAGIGSSKMPANQVLQIVQHLQKTIIEQGNEIKNLRSTFAKMT